MSKDDDDNKNGKKDYEVGYGKPPKKNQFGAEEGNPQNNKGRPPGRNVIEFDRLSEEALWDCVLQAAQMPVSMSEDGREMLVPYIMALAKRMAQDAIRGDRHARKDFIKLVEKATKGTDKMLNELRIITAEYEERRIKSMAKPGSLEHFDAMYAHYMSRKQLRPIIGGDEFLYEPGEPVTDEDWIVFIKQHEYLKANPTHVLSWPPKYSSGDWKE